MTLSFLLAIVWMVSAVASALSDASVEQALLCVVLSYICFAEHSGDKGQAAIMAKLERIQNKLGRLNDGRK